MKTKQRIVVVGGGFAGLNFVKHIDKKKFDVLLVDRNNFHSFPPLFYQIASSGLEPGSISFPFRREMQRGKARGARYHMGEVEEIDVKNKTVKTQYEIISYDKLVVAAGTTNNFFGNDELKNKVYTIKSTAQAMRARDEILDRLERACITRDCDERRKLLSFVVVGGGPAGVEVAGALGEMKRYIAPREYTSLSSDDISITLLEGAHTLVSAMSEKSQQDALRYLKYLMVDVKFNHQMKSYDGDMLILDDGTEQEAGMVIWTAGVVGQPIRFIGNESIIGHGHRLLVDEFNRVIGEPDIYAIGDMCLMSTVKYPNGHPQMAQVAIQQGILLARQINAGDFNEAFRYNDKGTMATVGRNLAVVDLGKLHLSGKIAWLTWMFIHLISILGMRNKISVLVDWIWSYFTYGTSLRLLLHTSKYPLR